MTILAGGIMIAFAAIAAGIGNALLFSKYLEGIARQPEAQGKLFGQAMIAVGLVEALPIIAIAFGILVLFGIVG
ncbi:F0F1 ATP synthase subunit C [Terrilactibacillus sp. BCM23-1]|uniref:ATP synthase subunit c n=1 Tax=Terrilactibacillus tamarindi TaxID=2599694 RepID=A0A6N8CMY5_9BACI|nr:F0F1 ATP synthase subunit C [Terrilactibacillus tamarindi]MTT30998.1 F0F1 ATP synthase subunit C [Terrilactibacillus tamarindi]